MKTQLYTMTRYLVAGGMGALVNFVLYFALLRIGAVWYILASVISFEVSIFIGFFLQKYITFRNLEKTTMKKQMSYYAIFSLMNLLINIGLLSFFVEILEIQQVLAKLISLALLAVWSYIVYQNYIFKNI